MAVSAAAYVNVVLGRMHLAQLQFAGHIRMQVILAKSTCIRCHDCSRIRVFIAHA
jgi:hypothetical protein